MAELIFKTAEAAAQYRAEEAEHAKTRNNLTGTVTTECAMCAGRVINRIENGNIVGYTCVSTACGFATVPARTTAQLVEMGKF